MSLNVDNVDFTYFDVIVLGPGGLKGFIELGALSRLEDKYLDKINTYVGVSIGSIICVLHLCGLSFAEISDIGMDINLFQNININNISGMIGGKGIISHDLFRNILIEAIMKKRKNVPTFAQLYKDTNKEFIATSYNLTRRKTYYFSRVTHPNMSIVEAAIASSSIPGIFYQYIFRDEVYIDGAFGNPYPIDIVDDCNNKILGIYIHDDSISDSSNLTKNISAIMHAPITELRRKIIENSSDYCKHLVLESNINDITGIQVDKEERISMFQYGYNAADIFIKNLEMSQHNSSDVNVNILNPVDKYNIKDNYNIKEKEYKDIINTGKYQYPSNTEYSHKKSKVAANNNIGKYSHNSNGSNYMYKNNNVATNIGIDSYETELYISEKNLIDRGKPKKTDIHVNKANLNPESCRKINKILNIKESGPSDLRINRVNDSDLRLYRNGPFFDIQNSSIDAQNSYGPTQNSHGPRQNSHGLIQNSYGQIQNSHRPIQNSHGPIQNFEDMSIGRVNMILKDVKYPKGPTGININS